MAEKAEKAIPAKAPAAQAVPALMETPLQTPAPANPERLRVVSVMARAIWQADFFPANPGATVEQRRQAWREARPDQMKFARRVARIMEQQGVTLTLAEAAEAETA